MWFFPLNFRGDCHVGTFDSIGGQFVEKASKKADVGRSAVGIMRDKNQKIQPPDESGNLSVVDCRGLYATKPLAR